MSGWSCISCGRPRQAGDPLLATTINAEYRTGTCAQCHRARVFRPYAAAGLPDLEDGLERKQRGQSHTFILSEYSDRFNAKLVELIDILPELTSEDVTAQVGLPPAGSHSVIGALMTGAAKRGLIVKTGRRRKAERPVRHAGELTVWVKATPERWTGVDWPDE